MHSLSLQKPARWYKDVTLFLKNELLRDNVVGHFLSQSLIFELTNSCNMNCVYCGNDKLTVKRGMMSLDSFRLFIENLDYFNDFKVKNVILQGNGEPFINPYVYDMIDILTECYRRILIVTNGKWEINYDRLESLFKVHSIRASVDALSQDLYEVGKPGQNVQRIVDKFVKIRKLKTQFRKDTPQILFRINVFKYNEYHVEEYIKRCQDLGFDGVHVVLGGGTALEPSKGVNVEVLKKYGAFVRLGEVLDHHESRNLRTTVKSFSEKQGQSLKYGNKGEHRNKHYIPQVLSAHTIFDYLKCHGTTVRWDGRVTLCCRDANVTVSIGNLTDKTFKELISYKNMDRIARYMIENRDLPGNQFVCANCPKFKSYLCSKLTPNPILSRGAKIARFFSKLNF